MADCSYSRCIQQRRNIKRELQRWTKNMVHIVGLERIAEELMGRRQWKLYQESMSRSYLQPLNNNVKPKAAAAAPAASSENCQEITTQIEPAKGADQQKTTAPSKEAEENATTKEETKDDPSLKKDLERERILRQQEAEERLKDWSPQSKCYFCVDGKLDSENTTHGVLSPRNSDSDSSDNSHSDSEAPPTLTPAAAASAGIFNNNNHHSHHRHTNANANNTMTTIESVTSMAALAAVAALSSGATPGNAAGVVPHLPFYGPAGLLQPNWYLANVARNFQQAERLPEVEKPTGEQPLDLSSKGGSNMALNHGCDASKILPNMRLPTLDSKHIFNSDFRAKPRMSAVAGRRTYTEDELQAALRDIQSGKLGTRRAAVIYGIPRSTLRNKVYKLALERERETHLVVNDPSAALKIGESEEDEEGAGGGSAAAAFMMVDDEKDLSGAEEEKEVEKALQAPLLSMADILRFSNLETNPEALKALLLKSPGLGKEGQQEAAWSGLEHSAVGPYIQNLLLNTAAAAAPRLDGDLNPLLPEVLRKMMVEERLFKEQLKMQQHNNGESDRLSRPSPSNSAAMRTERSAKSESDMEADDSPANVILKIPSFRPTTSKNGCDLFRAVAVEAGVGMVSPPLTSESGSPPILPGKGMSIKDVKDAIAQSISQKFQQNMEPARRPLMDMDFKRGGFTPPLGSISVIKNQQHHELGRAYQPPPKPQQHTNPSAQTQGGKGTRPKRGKYRNYDRDSLVEAVRAVQRGEMSVHRAGSYYGVPHSTLEYKVKERHLMRPRKRDPKPNPVDEKLASIKQSEMRNAQEKMKPCLKPPPHPQKFPPTSPNGMKIPIFDPTSIPPLAGYNPAPFPFWPHPGFHHIPLEYARTPSTSFTPNPQEFFASQMMQKLQEESARTGTTPGAATLAKSARQMAESLLDGTSSNGSFLDGIIRSSLESGVPNNEDKTPKEDKNVAPENMSNKALLDQLCRNSRLTPLPKPITTEPNSSGEENYRKGSPLNFALAKEEPRASPKDQQENSDVLLHTIELSNDSNESTGGERRLEEAKTTPPPRIYLKQELTRPENLKPEMLVRFHPDLERNGGAGVGEGAAGSASESDAAQD